MSDVAAAPKLSPARRRALLVLMDRHRQTRSALTAHATDVAEGHVNANAAVSLIGLGLATTTTGLPGCRYVRITDAGKAAAGEGWREELAELRTAQRNGGR